MSKSNSSLSEKALLEGITGDKANRKRYEKILYQRFSYLVKARKSTYGLTVDQAQQAYNDAILGLLKQLDRGDFRLESSLKTYLYKIFTRRCVDIFREAPTNKYPLDSLEAASELSDSSADFMRTLISQEEIEQALTLLKRLGEKCKQLILMGAQGYGMEEIRKHFGFKNLDTTYSAKHKCKKKLVMEIASLRMSK